LKGGKVMASVILHIDWEGPFEVTKVIERKIDKKKDCGIYQIYGNHPIYGKDSLLYIGETTDNTFSERFKVHKRDWLDDKDLGQISAYLGDVYKQSGEKYDEKKDMMSDEEWKELVKQCEQLLIYAFGPSYNSRNKQSINEDELRELHILNWCSRAALPPEVSGDRWTNKYGRE
jgi:hypothetical protein